jgi:ABC-type transport system involved in cytochrome c biogenesis ATPase subunit
MTDTAIAVAGLRKAFGDKTVLDGIDFEVPAGTVFSLLGPNGAGKTTTVNVLTTLMKADGGTARVAGHDVAADAKAVRSAIGVTGQFAAVDELLTGRENLQLMVDLSPVSAKDGKRIIAELLERFELTEAAAKPASTYSGGMRRKLDLAASIVVVLPIRVPAGCGSPPKHRLSLHVTAPKVPCRRLKWSGAPATLRRSYGTFRPLLRADRAAGTAPVGLLGTAQDARRSTRGAPLDRALAEKPHIRLRGRFANATRMTDLSNGHAWP